MAVSKREKIKRNENTNKKTDNSDESLDLNENTFENDEYVIQSKIDEIDLDVTENEILTAKRDLLKAYLVNLLLFKKQSEEEKEFSPIKEVLLKLQVLIEKIYKIDVTIEKIEESDSSDEKRTVPDYILKNKGKMTRNRKKEERNPRVKNKNKAAEIFKKGKLVVNKNIETKINKNKF